MAEEKVTALIAEDSPVISRELVIILKRLGLDVIETENGHAAWVAILNSKKLVAEKPFVILSDVNMPEMDGIQLLEKVRSHKEFERLPFIILTANKEELLRLTALCLNVNAFFIKPAEPSAILRELKKLFPKKKFQEI